MFAAPTCRSGEALSLRPNLSSGQLLGRWIERDASGRRRRHFERAEINGLGFRHQNLSSLAWNRNLSWLAFLFRQNSDNNGRKRGQQVAIFARVIANLEAARCCPSVMNENEQRRRLFASGNYLLLLLETRLLVLSAARQHVARARVCVCDINGAPLVCSGAIRRGAALSACVSHTRANLGQVRPLLWPEFDSWTSARKLGRRR